MYAGVVGDVPIRVEFRVEVRGHTVYFMSQSGSVTYGSGDGESTAYWVDFRPSQVGSYTFVGTLFVGGKHKHKAVKFAVRSH
jgi:hypothetical protein